MSDTDKAEQPLSLLNVLNNTIAKYTDSGFDFELWMEQDSSCLLCNTLMGLNEGSEWPDDPRLLLCESCLSRVLSEQLEKLEPAAPKSSALSND